MANFKAQIDNLPASISEEHLRNLLSNEGRVKSLFLKGSTCQVELFSDVLFSRIKLSPTGTMGLISFLSKDSAGLGELKAATIKLIG
jgi:hypothetical protein